MGSGPWDDRGYVEPEVDVWTRFGSCTKKLSGLKSYGLLSEEAKPTWARWPDSSLQSLKNNKTFLGWKPFKEFAKIKYHLRSFPQAVVTDLPPALS